jgi:signal transduction histidine kinase
MDETRETNTRFWSKLNLLNEIAAAFRSSEPVNDIVGGVLARINELVPFKAAGLYLYDARSGHLKPVVRQGMADNGKDILVGFGERSAVDWFSAERHEQFIDGEGGEQLLAIPLIVQTRPVGLIVFVSELSRSFRDKDRRFLLIAGDLIAVSLERQIYNKRLRAKNRALRRAQDELKVVRQNIIDCERLAAVRELAVSINHEINNPLSVIVGNIQCLLHKAKNLDKDVHDRLRLIEHEAMRIAEINQRLLKIEDLVSETYMSGHEKIKMIDLEKSTTGTGR